MRLRDWGNEAPWLQRVTTGIHRTPFDTPEDKVITVDSSFERDIFISYAHLDDEPLTEEEHGWVSAFDHALQKRLAQLLGRKADIWRDRKLQGDDIFGDEIIDQFPKLKILISIVSPRYLESEWCRKELHEFYEVAQKSGGVRVGNKSRIFKVVKTPVPHGRHPPEIADVLGYEFFQVNESGHFREFVLEKGSPTYYQFIEHFEDVAQDLSQLIRMLDEGAELTGGHDSKTATARPEKSVYLARTTTDLNPERDNIRRDLEKRGYSVFPDQELPIDGRFRTTVEGYLQSCKLAILLIGNKYGLVPEDEQRSMVAVQYELIQAAPLSRLIWMPSSDLSSEDQRRQDFITAVQGQAVAQPDTELLSGNLEDLKTVIIDTLERLAIPVSSDEATTIPRIYLMFDESDRDAVSPLDDYLYDQGFEVLSPIFEGDESEIREVHQDNLKACDGVLIYCDRAAESWLNFKMNDLRKAPGYRGGKPLKAGAVYLCGESNRFKERFRSREALVIKQFGPFSATDVATFVEQLHKGSS